MKRRDFTRCSLYTGIGLWSGKHNFGLNSATLNIRKIPKTDTHVHLFNLAEISYPWLDNAPEIKRNYDIRDFQKASRNSSIGKIVFMESGARPQESLAEIEWVNKQAKLDSRLRGIIARGDVNSDGSLSPRAEDLTATKLVKGIRGRVNLDLLQSEAFIKGMKALAKHQLSMDLLLRPALLQAAARVISKCPDTVFIIDHLAHPNIKTGKVDLWKKGMTEIAKLPNVNCKISGIVNVAGKNWSAKSLEPYVHYAIEQFGFDRIIYGGDWPNSLRASKRYRDWARAFEKITKDFSEIELKKLYHKNADRIYRLD